MPRKLPLLAGALVALALPAFADALRDHAIPIYDAHKDSVVSLAVLSKITVSAEGNVPPQLQAALAGQEKEQKVNVIGTVIDPAGLIVTALPSLDPASALNGTTVNTQAGPVKLKAASETKDIRVLTADGTEIPADLVMKDEDLGLAFVKIRADSEEAKGVKFDAVNLADAADGQLLDTCVALGRLDESLDRETRLLTGRITSLITSPRTRYLASLEQLVGGPVFLENGKLLGISVLYRLKDSSSSDSASQANRKFQFVPVILPARDIAKIAAQAATAPAGKK